MTYLPKQKADKICKAIFHMSIVLCVASVGAKLYCSNDLAIKNQELKDAATRQTQLEKEVAELTYVDSSLSSMSYIEEAAKKLGFVDMRDSLLSLDLRTPYQAAAVTVGTTER